MMKKISRALRNQISFEFLKKDMFALYNNQLVENTFLSPFDDRALQFGDGLFETIKVKSGLGCLLGYHLGRLASGAEALGLILPEYLSSSHLQESILNLMRKNDIQNDANVKLIVWRSNAQQRAYASHDEQVHTLLLTRASSQAPAIKAKVSFSNDVQLHYWKLSRFKTISALPYVIAARERDRRHLDELILLNVNEHITECVASNIFWLKEEVVYTPSLQTGCIAGVMRASLLDRFQKDNVRFKEVEATKEDLLKADAVFTTNSQGLQRITAIDGVTFDKIDYYGSLFERLIS